MKRYQPDVIYTRVGGSPKHVLHEHVSGDYVLHADHEAALAEAAAKECERLMAIVNIERDRLTWACNNMQNPIVSRAFDRHVMNRAGTADYSDCITFIDDHRPARGAA